MPEHLPRLVRATAARLAALTVHLQYLVNTGAGLAAACVGVGLLA